MKKVGNSEENLIHCSNLNSDCRVDLDVPFSEVLDEIENDEGPGALITSSKNPHLEHE